MTDIGGRPWHVYYCWADDGTLLYVGQTGESIVNRIDMHRGWHSPSFRWFYHCTRVTLSAPIGSKAEALAFERSEIGRLRPVFNRHHNPDPMPWQMPERPARLYGTWPEIELPAPAPEQVPA